MSEPEEMRVPCDQCGNYEFGVYYDSLAQGYHVECVNCGDVFHVR